MYAFFFERERRHVCIVLLKLLHFDEGTTDAGAAAACVDDCTQNWNPYKENKHT